MDFYIINQMILIKQTIYNKAVINMKKIIIIVQNRMKY